MVQLYTFQEFFFFFLLQKSAGIRAHKCYTFNIDIVIILFVSSGPMAHYFHTTHQQTYIAHVMSYAACIGPHQQAGRYNPDLNSQLNCSIHSISADIEIKPEVKERKHKI